MNNLYKLILTCLIAVLLLSLFACESDSDSEEALPTSEGSATAALSANEEYPAIERLFITDFAPGEATPWTDKEFMNDAADFQFAIVADRTALHRPGLFSQEIDRLNLLQPEFVISVGDLIEGYTNDQARVNEMWEEFDAIIDKLEMPFFRVVGNHDVSTDFLQQDWLDRHGRDYYSFLYKDALFLCFHGETVEEVGQPGFD